MSKHTPGPWTIQGAFIGTDDVHIAQVKGEGRGINSQRAEANSMLIASAPIMSDTLKRAAHVLAELPNQSPELIALRSQIVECIKQSTPDYYGSKPC
jgi:hypothetical protein